MGVRYLGPVNRHNLVDMLLLWYLVPVWDSLFATTVVGFLWSARSGRESDMAIGQFCWNAVGPPEWACEAMGSVVWVHCDTSPGCIKSIDNRARG